MTPRATYRLQLSGAFGFDDAAACAGYLAALGVSHAYCSPILQAAAGSEHGYDVVDPTRISGELGGDAGFDRFAIAMREHGIEILVDTVPNHMATAGHSNPWWWDLLTNGMASRYADYFDVDWQPATSTVKDKVLLAVLGDRYGRELDRGALTLEQDGREVRVRYRDQVFPVSSDTLDAIDLDRAAHDADTLDSLLKRQHYRLAYWRSAQEELNYRRFFTVDSLIGLRVERRDVFDDSHRLLLELVRSGRLTGLRIDHVDGLRDPAGYLRRLRDAAGDAYIVVEKILADDETLPAAFPVEGTTGYEFAAAVDGLFVDSDNEPSMTALYHAFSGETQPYSEVARACKLEITTTELAPDLERLTAVLVDICDADRRHRDRTRRELREAVREVAVAFGVYRTYVMPGSPPDDHDRTAVDAAIEEAARRRPDIDADLLALVRDTLLLERPGDPEAEFTARFQQFTPAVMAKGVEDTAFYRYNRLVSLNEVGGDPGTFGRPTGSFHAWCTRAASERPASMLTLSTHDTKRSSDVRARIDVLSEMPAEWEAAVRRWAEHNDRYRADGYPDRNLEYLAYQTLVGAWPIDAQRLTAFLHKAAREAKLHTSWLDPVAAYEDAIARFAVGITTDTEFTSDLESFLGRNQVVALARVVSLAQTTLLLTCPGVPDIYQGSELWDLALVDPDNRRPVDYESRARLLHEVASLDAPDVVARPDDGTAKMWLIARLLNERSRRPDLFGGRDHAPVEAGGVKARHAVSFVRGPLLVVVPRLVAALAGDWGDTWIELPAGRWRRLLTGGTVEGGGQVAVGALLDRFPVAVMAKEA